VSRRQVERDLVHAQLRLMSTDAAAVDDAIRYITRALVTACELAKRPAVEDLELPTKEPRDA
jgi:hypothetical protein